MTPTENARGERTPIHIDDIFGEGYWAQWQQENREYRDRLTKLLQYTRHSKRRQMIIKRIKLLNELTE